MSLTADVAATLLPGFRGTSVPEWLVRAHADGLVSVCLYGANVTGPDDLAAPVHHAAGAAAGGPPHRRRGGR